MIVLSHLPSPGAATTIESLTNLDAYEKSEAISMPKTKAQHNIMIEPKMPDTTEGDVFNLPEDKQFKLRCEF